jgi:hypothetical protein
MYAAVDDPVHALLSRQTRTPASTAMIRKRIAE